mmetsp:Transcript_46474/g.88736  ORF Transcript_46474/g.88736 Transcript_46474/m.88736 type:complete len:259 (+) Transcript_46474:84-860(+)|eukprot:CAMPEP_0114326030 /NCGR_PEP_ID=MMETSP0059-20121206/29482_1 /TAXON_ID=36894 /ORGANISM="Pyramimonas parkeae, Strain CCMP726" /LENGTH=258 /DNA_ID=CAMNT_0001454927 /DNA_START=37 /DNA_END=813 /DNA_ORIENTATION=+
MGYIEEPLKPPTRNMYPRLAIPSQHYSSTVHPPPDPFHNKNPGPGEYRPQFASVQGFRLSPAWTVPPVSFWRQVQHPLNPSVYSIGKMTWDGRGVQPFQPESEELQFRAKSRGPGSVLQPSEMHRALTPGPSLPPFFRRSVSSPAVQPVSQLVQNNWSQDGSRLSHYRKTMEVVGVRRSARRAAVPTGQCHSTEETFAKYHPALMLPDPTSKLSGKLRVGSGRRGVDSLGESASNRGSSSRSGRSTGSTAHAPFLNKS